MNLSMNNIYFNSINEIFLGPIKIYDYEENELWYSPPENEFFRELDSIYDLILADIWSIGCIVTELFFLSTPLFYSFSSNDKIRKIIEVKILLLDNRNS